MIRPPSLQRAYDDFYSGDPAFEQCPADADEAAKKEHARKWEQARETGDWSHLLVPGTDAPTKFVMEPLTGDQYRTLADMLTSGQIGGAKLAQLAFRAAVRSIVNFGDLEVKRENSGKLGMLAVVRVTDKLDAVDPGIVGELGDEVLRRAREVSPK